MALQGKRIFITGGAGFIATTLGRRIVEQNEVVALDNLHRDALSATDLGDHPNFTLHEADVLEEFYDELARHYSLSDHSAKAAEYLIRAGERARRLYANREAASSEKKYTPGRPPAWT